MSNSMNGTLQLLADDAQEAVPRPTGFLGVRSNEAEWMLIERVQGGDSEAFYDLVQPHERGAFLAAFSILRNEADAEEAAQEAILKALQNLPRFRREAKFSTWLIQIAINEAKMKIRKDRRHLYESIEAGQVNEEGEYVPRDFADWRAIPSEALEQSELREALARALDSLPEKYRTVVILRDVQQMSGAETSEALGISEANVRIRLSRARLQMRDALAPGLGGAWTRKAAAGCGFNPGSRLAQSPDALTQKGRSPCFLADVRSRA